MALEFASQEMKQTREHNWTRSLMTEEMQGGRELCNHIQIRFQAMQWASEEMKGDRELYNQSNVRKGVALQWASERRDGLGQCQHCPKQ